MPPPTHESQPPARAGRPLKVAMYEPTGRGGICHYTYQLAQALSRHGCDVTVLTPESYELADLPRGFRVRFLARRSRLKRLLLALTRLPGVGRRSRDHGDGPKETGDRLSARFSGPRLRVWEALTAAEIAIRRFDVVHMHSIGLGKERSLVRLVCALGRTVVCTAHEVLPHESAAAVPEDLAVIYESASRIVVHAERTRGQILRLFPVDPRKVEVIPHGSYDFFFPEGRISRDDARGRVGLPADRPTALFFGMIRRYKGLEFLAEAFARIEAVLPAALLAIVGEVFRGDEAAHAEYSRLLADVARRPNVRRVEGYVPLGDVGLYLSAADVVVLPYTETSQSGVLLAAFAAGRPAVVTDAGGLSEVVTDGITGFVVPARDSAALAGAIRRVLEDPALGERMGQNAAREADTTYSWDRIAERTVRLYVDAISDRGAPSDGRKRAAQ